MAVRRLVSQTGRRRRVILPVPNLLPWLRAHPRLAALAVTLLVLGPTAAGIFLWRHSHLVAAQQAYERCAFDEAQRHLDLCLKVPFGRASLHLLAARTARRRDAYAEAQQHLAACLQHEGMTPAIAREHVLLAAQQGDLDDSAKLREPHPGLSDPEAVLVLEALAKGYVSRCCYMDALDCLNKLLDRQPQHPQGWLLRARVWEVLARSGRPEHETEALADYEKAVALQPSLEVRLGLAGTLYRVGRPWDAAIEYERLRQEQADNPDVLLGLARCRYNLKEVAEAQRLLDDLLHRHPEHAAALLERGRLAFHAGDLAEAERCLRQAASAASPCDSEPHRLLAQCLEAEHKDEDARRALAHVSKSESNALRGDRLILEANAAPHNVALRCEVARELMRLGREADGVSALFLVLEQEPRYAPAHAALADYFERTGQSDRAARHRRAGLRQAEDEKGAQ
jgi:tetratricopeptide (TPR) repeat protein